MKKTILSLLVALMATTGATAQSPTTSGITWNASTNSGTFNMPAYDVEVSTELWYKVDEEKTRDENIAAYGTKSDFFLNRTLTADVWNTFASPFAIAAGDMAKYFGAGAKVRQLNTTSVDGTVLTLNFEDATDPIYDGNSSSLWGANESSVLLYEGLRKEQGERYGQTGSETACNRERDGMSLNSSTGADESQILFRRSYVA